MQYSVLYVLCRSLSSRSTTIRSPRVSVTAAPADVTRREYTTYTCNALLIGRTLASDGWRDAYTDPQGATTTRNLQWSPTRLEDPRQDLLVVHCFCLCGSGALRGISLGGPWNVKLSSLILTFLLIAFFVTGFVWVYSGYIGFFMFCLFSCCGLVVSSCQVIG